MQGSDVTGTVPAPTLTNPLWYSQAGAVQHWFYGVFEGGGAKGIAFIGALQELRAQGCWFRGVAGASAGAITATLIASGASPEEIESASEQALKELKVASVRGLLRLRAGKGYFPTDGLQEMLEKRLRLTCGPPRNSDPSDNLEDDAKVAPVTFKELFEATRIELNIVAADLSLQSQVVFSCHETPNCSVTDAVIASSSIPFAFSSRLLCDNGKGDPSIHHTIVDGGVWANFPMFVFEDQYYRKHIGQEPIAEQDVIGFLLHEYNTPAPPRGEAVRFVRGVPEGEFFAKEWGRHPDGMQTPPANLVHRCLNVLIWPFAKMASYLTKNGLNERGRWPDPASGVASGAVKTVNGLLGGLHALLPATVAVAVVTIGGWTISKWVVGTQWDYMKEMNWSQPIEYIGRIIMLGFAAILVFTAILLPLVMLFGVLLNMLALLPARRILYGLVKTYITAPGAPNWIAKYKPNVIPLPIPPELGTLLFVVPQDLKDQVRESSRRITAERLPLLISLKSELKL